MDRYEVVSIGGPRCGAPTVVEVAPGMQPPEKIVVEREIHGYVRMHTPPVWLVKPPEAKPQRLVYLWEPYYLAAA